MIVAAPDHWSRDLFHVLDRVLGGTPAQANDPVDDLRMTRQLLEDADADPASKFSGHVDNAHVAAVGHSAGGGTVLGFARGPGIAGYVSLASGILRNGPPSTGPTTTTTTPAQPPAMPDVPSLFMAGARDVVAPWKTVTKPAYEAAPAPSRLWVIERAGHNAFDDFCTFGNGKGIIGVAEASGLGGFLDAQPMFRRLGEDGCLRPAIAVEKTFPIVNHAVTAFLRELFGVDPVPVGLGPDVSKEYVVPVAISEKLST
jgi:dienelactone hydrolase